MRAVTRGAGFCGVRADTASGDLVLVSQPSSESDVLSGVGVDTTPAEIADNREGVLFRAGSNRLVSVSLDGTGGANGTCRV